MTTPTAQAPAARADQLNKIYGDGPTRVTALDQVCLEIGTGTFTAIMGPSGSGKSTLMHCMAGLDSADGGQVWIGGTEITTLPERRLTRLRRDRVGFVFQAYNLLPALTAADNMVQHNRQDYEGSARRIADGPGYANVSSVTVP